MQATALGRYLLYGPGRDDAARGAARRRRADRHARARPPTGACDRSAAPASRSPTSRTGRASGVGAARPARPGRPAAGALVASRPPRAAPTFPEVEVNVTGTPFKGASPTARVRGFIDDHIHLGAFEFLGGRFHCGRPWSPYGVTVALQDCADHYPNGAGRGRRELPRHRQPGRHPQPGRLAELRGLAARRVADPRGHLLEVDRARLARRAADHGQRPRREPRALRALSAQAERLQRDGQRAQAGPGHARARRTTSTPSSAAPARASSGSSRSPAEARAGHQRRQARGGPRRRGVRGARLRAVQRHAEVRRRADRPRARRALRRSACGRCSRSTSSTTRSAARNSTSGTTGVARQRRQQVRHRRSSGRADHCDDRRPRQRADQPDRQTTPRWSTRCSARRSRSRCSQGQLPVYPPGAALQPEGPDRARRARDPVDDAPRHDRRDRPHEREGAPADAVDPRGRATTPA